MSQGNLFILSAPSGAGKSSLISALLKQPSERPMQVSVSHTTRAPRPGEIDGQHYHFVSVEQFEQLIAAGQFYEYAKVFSNYYGTSETAIEQQLNQGIDVFLDIDWQGARQVKKRKPDVTTIFICPPSLETLEQRLRHRGQDSEAVIAERMAQAKAECSHCDEFDYIIVNDEFEQALEDLITIVQAQRLRTAQQKQKYQSLFDQLLANN
jgi:guanylate kinase